MIEQETLQSSLSDLVQHAVDFMPTLLGAALILLVGWLLARVIASIARGIARRLGVDALVERSGLAEGLAQAQITQQASVLIGSLVFWLVFLSALLISLDHLGLTVAVIPLQGLINYLPKVLAAILVLIAGAVVAQVLGRATQAAVAGMGVEFHRELGRGVRTLVLVATVVIAVQQLGFDLTLFTGTFINLVTILAAGVALAFALGGRDVVRNILAGFYVKEMYAPGARLVVDGQEGILEAIGTLNAEMAVGADRLIFPNAQLIDLAVRIVGDTGPGEIREGADDS